MTTKKRITISLDDETYDMMIASILKINNSLAGEVSMNKSDFVEYLIREYHYYNVVDN